MCRASTSWLGAVLQTLVTRWSDVSTCQGSVMAQTCSSLPFMSGQILVGSLGVKAAHGVGWIRGDDVTISGPSRPASPSASVVMSPATPTGGRLIQPGTVNISTYFISRCFAGSFRCRTLNVGLVSENIRNCERL
jgi:hypothetical protein